MQITKAVFFFFVIMSTILLIMLSVDVSSGYARAYAEEDEMKALGDSNTEDNYRDVPVRRITFGEKVKLDDIGPVIVQIDCTLKRIENWHSMTEGEKEATFRRIGGRNQKRLDLCREKLAANVEEKEDEGEEEVDNDVSSSSSSHSDSHRNDDDEF
jgi:hypothetical protein